MKNKKLIIIILIIVTLILLGIIGIYIYNNLKSPSPYVDGKINLVINNNNVTKKLKNDLFINDKGVIYLSKNDIQNYFDKYILVEEEYNRIITTCKDNIGLFTLEGNNMALNDAIKELKSGIVKEDDTYFFPISELSELYNVDVNYIEDEKILLLDSLDRELITANVSGNSSVKLKKTALSKTMAKVKKDETVVVIEKSEGGWAKIRTKSGYIGYIKGNKLKEESIIRTATTIEEDNKKVSLVWDYFSEYAKAPNRAGTKIEGINVVAPSFFSLVSKGDGKINANVGTQGVAYVNWAKQNNYKVWAIFSNNSYKETTSEVLKTYKSRTLVINNIVTLAKQYNVDGINLDFENVSKADKDLLSRFIIELKPRLKKAGITLSVDVTAPDGGDDWSECYDRNLIGDVADYIVFMAYDQYGLNSKKPGTTAGYNWVESGLKKFIDREEVKSNKIILGIPLYTRIWGEKDGELIENRTIDMNKINQIVPQEIERKWLDDVKQNYVEYIKEEVKYKMWIEDEESIKAKLSLIKEYNLAGAGFWEKDRETEGIWSLVNKELNG